MMRWSPDGKGMALMDRDTFVARSRLWILTCRIINENREVQGPLVTEAMAETPSGHLGGT